MAAYCNHQQLPPKPNPQGWLQGEVLLGALAYQIGGHPPAGVVPNLL